MFRSLKWAVALALLALIHTSAGRQISSEPFGNVEDAGYSFVSTEEDREYPVDPVELVDEDSIESEEDDLFDENDDDVDDDDNDDDEPLDEFPVIEGGLEEDEEEEEQENSFKTDLELLEGNISTKTDVDFEKDNDIMMGDQPAPTEKKKKGKKNKKRRKGKGKKRKGKGKRKGRKNKGERKRKGKKAATSDVKPILAKNATLPGLNGTNLQADMPKLWVDENGKLVVDESDPLSGVQGQDPKDPDNFWPDINGDPKNPWRKEQPWPGNDPRAANRSPWTAVDPRAVNTNTNNNNINNNPHRNEPWSQPDPRTGRVNQPVSNNRQPNIWPDPSNRVVPDMGNTNKYFDVGPLEVFMQNCPDCFVQVPGAVCPFHGPAIELKKWAGELEDVLSHGCKRPEECKEPGTCCLSRIAPFEPTIVRMTQMLKDVYNMVQRNCKGCGVDGNWSPWGPWNTCDRTCGPGTRIRTRECNNPAPSLTGKTCVGESMDRKDCFNPDCCVNGNWGMWTSWGQCPVTCGRSQVSRSRQCSNPPPNHCGQTCPGNPYETKNEYCGPEPVNGNWAMWQQWSPCTRTCDFGTRTRIRTCTNPAPNACGMSCPGSASEEAGCNNPSCLRCVDGNWASWGPWSNCPVTCGDSTVSRSRTCSNPPPNGCGRECFGDPVESKLQNCGPREQHGNWAMWSSWSQCSASCGPGTYTRSRTCSAPPANLCGRQCDGQSFQTAPCNREDCRQCVDGNWGQWNSWSQCPMTCGESTVTRTRYCNSPPPNFCGVSCPGSGTETKRELCGPPAQDGNWAMWSSWSQCSTTCGPGTYTRTRTCSNPPASACGRQCPGPAFESGTCQQQPCRQCVDGNWGFWGSWSQCSESCGDSTVTRTRLCNNPPQNFCGTPCLGDDRESKLQTCGPREVNGNWAQWSSWGQCSVTCGSGQHTRSRTCSAPPANACGRECPGPSYETGTCRREECITCVDGNWGFWGPWSQCSESCGDSTVTRTRLCNNPPQNFCGTPCLGDDRESKLQICGPREVNGNWAQWSSWSQCSVTCGSGQHTRSRTCSAPPANACGRECPGPSFETGTCRQQPCITCIDGNWGIWGQWSQCSQSCGDAPVSRTRLCNNPQPNFCGSGCVGDDTETRMQTCGPQEVDGNWGSWENWSQCSATCGPGRKRRSRRCDRPPANVCGDECRGRPNEVAPCQLQECVVCVDGNWGSWASWSQCSTSCGDGMVSRTRMCNNPPNNFCGTPCLGDDRESKQTQCGPRRDDGRWSPWGSWSRCSATCGRGQRRRTRSCSNPFPNACSRSCAGPDFEVDYCDGPSCEPVCVDGNWGSWGRWSQCPVTCGDAEVTRTRMCNNPAPNVCGQRCPGSDREAKLEMCGPPAVDGGWTSWGSWSQCSATCGPGQHTRTRTCSNPPATACGRQCPGPSFETGPCEDRRCEPCEQRQWATWETWSQCSATCGRGVQTRSRTCRVVVAGRNCGLRGCEGRDREQQACRDAECARYTYDTWGAWCPCDCRTGKQTRRRECVRVDDRGRRVPAELGLCQGDAREEKYCDVRRFCPACITSCENQPDGDYPSCYGCQEYIRCKDRVAEPFTCNRGNTEWDAFVRKCVSPPSPSCALAAPVTDCTNTVDGKYHSDRGCNDYIECVNGVLNNQMCPRRDMEFNLHLQTCEDGRTKSPTCIRQARRTPEINLAIIGGAVKPVNDAPADMYYDERNGLSPVERRERYEKERLEAEMTREKDARRARLLAEKLRDLERKENRLVLGGEKVESRRRVNPGCVRSCDGLTTGRYPSCRGCNYFVICTIRGRFRERKCSHNHEFDILRERCRKHSHSCILE